MESVNELNRDLHHQLHNMLGTLSGRNDLSEDLRKKLDSIKYLNSDIANKLNSIVEACDEVLEKIRECVLLAGFSGGEYQFSNGISLFFPWSLSAYNTARTDYEKLHFIKAKNGGRSWNKFLKKYLGEVTYRKSIGQDGKKHILNNPYHWANTVRHKAAAAKIVETSDILNTKLAHSADNKMTHSPDNKMTHSVDNKLIHSAENKMTHSPDNKMTHSVDNKMTHSPDNKMTHSPDNKMGGGEAHYFELFEQFDNTERPWNILGFTKKPPTDPAKEKNDDGKKLKNE